MFEMEVNNYGTVDANVLYKKDDTVPFDEQYIPVIDAGVISGLQTLIDNYKETNGSVGELSDGYHTFNELYHHRSLLFMALCMTAFKDNSWKSLLHSDPNDKMYDGMFIMGVDTPYGQATYHFDIDPYWSMTKFVKEVDRAPKYDGHTPAEAIDRIFKFAKEKAKLANTTTKTINIDQWGAEPITVPCGQNAEVSIYNNTIENNSENK